MEKDGKGAESLKNFFGPEAEHLLSKKLTLKYVSGEKRKCCYFTTFERSRRIVSTSFAN